MNIKSILSKENLLKGVYFIIIFLLFTPSEKIKFALPFIILLIFLFKEKAHIFLYSRELFRKHFFIKVLAMLFIYQFLNYIFALLNKRADLLTFPLFILTFWSSMAFLLLANKKNHFFIKKWVRVIIIFQIAIVILRCLVKGYFIPDDLMRGFISSSHWLGLCMIWLLFVCIMRRKNSILNIVIIIFASFVLYLTDAKMVVTIAIIILPILFGILVLRRYHFSFFLKLFLYCLLLCFILFLDVYVLKIGQFSRNEEIAKIERTEVAKIERTEVAKIERTEGSKIKKIAEMFKRAIKGIDIDYNTNTLTDLYINGKANHKLLFIKRGFQYLLKNHLILIGTSPGTLGSRASNVRARDVLYKPEGPKLSFLNAYSSPATKEVYNNLFTKHYHDVAAGVINTLALPFSSVFSFSFENGLIGLILLFIFVFSVLRMFFMQPNIYALESIFLIVIILLLGLFDTVWERPFVMGFLYLILSANFYQQKD